LDKITGVRATHVENLLAKVYDRAKDLRMKLTIAVFPYLISNYVGQDPKDYEEVP